MHIRVFGALQDEGKRDGQRGVTGGLVKQKAALAVGLPVMPVSASDRLKHTAMHATTKSQPQSQRDARAPQPPSRARRSTARRPPQYRPLVSLSSITFRSSAAPLLCSCDTTLITWPRVKPMALTSWMICSRGTAWVEERGGAPGAGPPGRCGSGVGFVGGGGECVRMHVD